ncbi:MAG TPA: hypothetical protein PK400_13590 [Phycisphaerales bacterium]|nr:hypothetical protein [Phycisphaerales bacterium]HRQ74844.1 hypothetical protein [Phycisphaerales bacterium]
MTCKTAMRHMRVFRGAAAIFIVGLVLAVTASEAYAQATLIRRVDIYNGSTGGNGTGWNTDAYKFLQDALTWADFHHANVNEDDIIHIWVAAGTYRPDQPAIATGDPGFCTAWGDCDKSRSFHLRNNVHLYGGFEGDEEEFDDRDPAVHLTILSGDLLNNDDFHIDEFGDMQFDNYEDNSWHVVIAENVGITAVLDGFTIRGGHAVPVQGGQTYKACGGGILCIGASPVIRDCIIKECFSKFSITQTVTAPCGGGMHIEYTTAPAMIAAPRIERCVFTYNKTTFGSGGAVGVEYGCDAVLIDCTITHNRATQNGGGVAVAGSANATTMLTIVNSTLGFNTSVGSPGGGGGAMLGEIGTLRIWNTVIHENNAVGGGGGIYQDGGTLEVINCTIADNTAHEGGGLYSGSNDAEESFALDIRNSILWGNERHDALEQIFLHANVSLVIDRCNVQGDICGVGGLPCCAQNPCCTGSCCTESCASFLIHWNASTNKDPKFLGYTTNNIEASKYRLRGRSPCIDTAYNWNLPCDIYELETPIAGLQDVLCPNEQRIPVERDWLERVVEANYGMKHVDMGAFEYQERLPRCPGDLNADGFVDIHDLIRLLYAWGTCLATSDCFEDLDEDGEVDILDLVELLGAWGMCGATTTGDVPLTVEECLEKYDPGTPELEACLEAVALLEE